MRVQELKNEIKSLTERDVKIIAATKYFSTEQTREIILSGIDAIGENRIDSISKFPSLPKIEKHFIGHLQSNKVQKAVKYFDCIQTIDSLKLAKEIDKRSKSMPVMIQVNVSGEKQKFGVSVDDVFDLYNEMTRLKNIEIIGLMTMAPHIDPELTRPVFKTLRMINDRLKLEFLSMGMSNDYKIAIEEGSNMIRVGSILL